MIDNVKRWMRSLIGTVHAVAGKYGDSAPAASAIGAGESTDALRTMVLEILREQGSMPLAASRPDASPAIDRARIEAPMPSRFAETQLAEAVSGLAAGWR